MTRKKKSKTFSERSWRTLVGGKRRRPLTGVAWRRIFLRFGKVLLLLILVGGIGFGFWWGREFLARQSGPLDLAGPSVPIASVSFKTDGVLDLGWIKDRLDLPVQKTLMELDLHDIQVKLESEPQIASARVRRLFPDVLGVELIERKPVLRLGVRPKGGKPELWLVSRGGVVYRGQNYSYASLEILPWIKLDPVLLKPDGSGGYKSVAALQQVSPLLELVRRDYPELYRDFKSVSFLRPAADPSDPGAYVQVQTRKVKEIRFAPREYPSQLRRLKYLLLDPGIRAAQIIRSIDLSHGRSVFADLRPT